MHDATSPSSLHVEQQQEIDRLRSELAIERKAAALGLAVASMAHEVNNLLTPVLTYAQMALRQLDNHALVEKALHRSSEGVQRASRISQSILRLARQQQGRGVDGGGGAQQPHHPHCDIASVCMQALDGVMLGLQRDEIEVLIDIEPDLHAAIDAIELEHVLLNLLLNAHKALNRTAGPKSITIRASTPSPTPTPTSTTTTPPAPTASTGSTWSDQPFVRIEVLDTGTGIPAELLPRLFQPYATLHQNLRPTGHGLGLMLCRHLIEQAGGLVTGENLPTGGAVFRILVPKASTLEQPRRAA
jgi:signal transduction histidine kinase